MRLENAKKKLKEILKDGFILQKRPWNDITTSLGTYIVMSKTKGELIIWGGMSGCRGIEGSNRCRTVM